MLLHDDVFRCCATVQWGWASGIQTVQTIPTIRPKIVTRKSLLRQSVTRAHDHDESETEGSCLETVESGNTRQPLDSVEEEALKPCSTLEKVGRSRLKYFESGEERQMLNSSEEETFKVLQGGGNV